MERNRFAHVCSQAMAGNDTFVRHPVSNEEGMVTSCSQSSEHLIVTTATGAVRCWDYHECEDLQRPKLGPMS